ncbi:FAST kinase domain-containing protein 4 [Apis cerana]|uniref:FAST kinase domain-containing protein 4 n=1 Tax=Apis cerana TaxID=7461 RepID=UPI002B226DC1|nr:FAST kinase domain-containing protein 4 [Apis cerana]XP_061929936.1 FAST kinase domain-containing protein 4 [Apis cerana]
MLQFNGTFSTIATRLTSRFLWRLNATLITNTATVTSESKVNIEVNNDQVKEMESHVTMNNIQGMEFNELKINLCKNLNIKPIIITKIEQAQTVNELLEIMKISLKSQDDIFNALKTITIWASKNSKNDLNNICKKNFIQTKKTEENIGQIKNLNISTENDLSAYSDLSTSQMIKEINKLAYKGDRNIQLLNFFFQNIIEYHNILSAGACSNLMFNMNKLSYSDERLLKKICKDFIENKKNKKNIITAVTTVSILKSMAQVRYKNNKFLNFICEDIINSKTNLTAKQITSILHSFALLGYYSDHINKLIEIYVSDSLIKNQKFVYSINLIWSFAVLKMLQNTHAEYVLDEEFLSKLTLIDDKRILSYKLKLLNINGYAQCALKNYSGPFLNKEIVPDIVNIRSKQKKAYIDTLELTLQNMLPSPSYYKMNINTKMGFLLDAELCVDLNLNFIPIDNQEKMFIKIALILLDYYDMCLGDSNHHGLIKLYSHLLECKKYKVMHISYQYFGIEDKLERRISYIKNQLKNTFKKI